LHIAWAQRLARLIYHEGFWPIAPHLYAPQFLDDSHANERLAGLLWGLDLLTHCTRIYAFSPDGVLSSGMIGELEQAHTLGLPLFWLDLETLNHWSP
jgi:hypothetical protein